VTIKILPNERGVPQSKLADAELVFEEEGVLCGLKLVGFAVWEGREGPHVTFPARPLVGSGSGSGGRRSYLLLRPAREAAAQEPLRQQIMQAFLELQRQRAGPPPDDPPPDDRLSDDRLPGDPLDLMKRPDAT